MRYFQVSTSSEPSVIGVTNGVYQLEIDEKSMIKDEIFEEFVNHFDNNNVNFWSMQDHVKNLKSPLIRGKLLKKAKITDIMGYAPEFHTLYDVYSQKYIDILKAFNAGDYSTFDFKVEGISTRYYLLFFKNILLNQLNFKKSILYSGNKILNNVEYQTIENYDEYLEVRNRLPLLRFERIAVDNKYSNMDVIKIQASGQAFYSEKLIDFLLDCGITGLEVAYNNSIQLEFV